MTYSSGSLRIGSVVSATAIEGVTMGWKPDQDPQRRSQNNPNSKSEHPPKRQVDEQTAKKLGRTAIRGNQK
jgi:hypothetical protein